MDRCEKAIVADLRRDAKKIGVWSEVREDLKNAADLIEELCGQRDELTKQVDQLKKERDA